MRFQFRACRTCRPEHALDAKSGRKKIAKNSRPRSVARKVRKEIRRLPVCDSRQNERRNVFQQSVKWFTVHRRIYRQLCANLTRLRLRKYGERLDARLVVGDPIHHGMAMAAEFVGGHVERFFFRHNMRSRLQMECCYASRRSRVRNCDPRPTPQKPYGQKRNAPGGQLSRPKYSRVLYSNGARPSTEPASKMRLNSRNIGAYRGWSAPGTYDDDSRRPSIPA